MGRGRRVGDGGKSNAAESWKVRDYREAGGDGDDDLAAGLGGGADLGDIRFLSHMQIKNKVSSLSY